MNHRAVTIAGVMLLVLLMLPLRAGFTDDGFIHIRYADNLIHHGEYSFNLGEPSFGTTSPLWVMALAAIGKFTGGGESLIWISRALSWLSAIACVLLIGRMARRAGGGQIAIIASTLMLAAHVWFVRWSALSMETSAAVLAVILVGIAAYDQSNKTIAAGRTGIAMGLATLIRPECYLFVPVYAVASLARGARSSARSVTTTFLIFAALLLPWWVFVQSYIGRFLPNTVSAKSGGLTLDPAVVVQNLPPVAKIVASAEAIPVLLLALAFFAGTGFRREVWRRHLFHVGWIIALPMAYVLFDVQVLARYMLLVSPFVLVMGALGLESMVKERSRRMMVSMTAAAVALAVVLNVAVYFWVVVKPSQAFSQDLSVRLTSLGRYIRANTPSDAVVAAADIGYLGFYSHREVLDLGGLVDNATAELRDQYTYEDIVDQGLFLDMEHKQADYFIDRAHEARRFDGQRLRGVTFIVLRVDTVRNLGIRNPGPFYYTLYELSRDDD